MSARIIAVLACCLAIQLGACSGKKKPAPSGSETPATTDGDAATGSKDNAASGKRSPSAPVELCIDPSDLQIEPLDLEALQDEMATVDLGGPLGTILDGLAAHGTPVPLDGGDVALPALRCSPEPCSLVVLTIDKSGAEKKLVTLPGQEGVERGSDPELLAASADVNSDGKPDLWVGYRHAEANRAASLYTMAALSLPDMAVQWHETISRSAPGDDQEGCEGALYPADADCDGDGDIVLVQRCGPMRCLGDSGHGNPGCKDNAPKETAAIYLWDDKSGRYESASAAGSKP